MAGRPAGVIPAAQMKELHRASTAALRANTRLKVAVVSALAAGGSYSEVAKAAGIAKSTVQKWAKLDV